MAVVRKAHWLEAAGLAAVVIGLAMNFAGQLGPDRFPDARPDQAVSQYRETLSAVRSEMDFYRRLGLAGHYIFLTGGFAWAAGAAKGRHEEVADE